uniref:Uncharacterized protein n=1 Tax=viral metagenome TaxID=1070528 RepID=A0A6H1ZKY4_9ZZZZ
MSVMISGARIDSIELIRKDEGVEFKANYSLVKDDGTVMAKQSVNGYGDIKLNLSAEMAKAIQGVTKQLKKEIESIIGITEE